MRKLIFTLIVLVLFSPAANAAVKWNNSSSSNSSSNENSAAWWAKTKNMKKGFFCQDEIAKSYLSFHRQKRSAWAWEIELRPWVEKF